MKIILTYLLIGIRILLFNTRKILPAKSRKTKYDGNLINFNAFKKMGKKKNIKKKIITINNHDLCGILFGNNFLFS